MKVEDITRDDSGLLPAYAWPGGYPIVYLAADLGFLCPKCANAFVEGRDNEEQLKPAFADVHYEGTPIQCENCNTMIESAYGDPDNEND